MGARRARGVREEREGARRVVFPRLLTNLNSPPLFERLPPQARKTNNPWGGRWGKLDYLNYWVNGAQSACSIKRVLWSFNKVRKGTGPTCTLL